MSEAASTEASGTTSTRSLRERLLASRLGRGDLGFLPVLLALVVIAIVFEASNSTFLTPRNLSNLTLQLGVLGIITLGLVLVLLIGEIDLSAGSVSGLTASVMAILLADHGFSGAAGIAVAIGLGALIGIVQGLWIVVVRAPSFIVTLTGLLVWQGSQHLVLGYEIGAVEINDPLVTSVASTFMPTWLAIGLTILIATAAAAYALRRLRHERPTSGDAWAIFLRAAVYPLVAVAVVLILSRYFGVPYLLILVVGLAALLTLVTEWTPLGVHIFAVGGNAEAARRGGINVAALRVAVFCICSSLAALAGVVSASRQYAVDSNTGGGNMVLDGIAAAVIGGTSLFGGRGRVVGGLLGAVVIASVANGLDLNGQSADVKTIITGLILLAAVSVDMLARRRRISSGAAGA
jgi:D-xylose transport system permease protein